MKVSDMTRAMCLPEYRSRTTERVTTTLAAASPCVSRQPRSATKLSVSPQRVAARTYNDRPVSNTGRLPYRSDITPQNSWPVASPTMYAVTTHCP